MAGELKSGAVKAEAMLEISEDWTVRGGRLLGTRTYSHTNLRIVRSSAGDPALLTRLLDPEGLVADMLSWRLTGPVADMLRAMRIGTLQQHVPTTLADGTYKVDLSQSLKMTLDVQGEGSRARCRLVESSGLPPTAKTSLPAAQNAEVLRLVRATFAAARK